MTISILPWDSKFFGISVGDLTFSQVNPSLEDQIHDSNCPDLLYLRYRGSNQSDLERLKTISDCWVEQVTFEKSIDSFAPWEPKYRITEAKELSEELIELSIVAGTHSRFHKDRRLKRAFESLYREWIVQSISGAFADKVFISQSEGIANGLITVSLKESRFAVVGLLSVSPAMQGKGIAADLLRTVERWAVGSGADHLRITTQMENEAAVKFYKKMGYSAQVTEHIFHLWKEDSTHENPIQ